MKNLLFYSLLVFFLSFCTTPVDPTQEQSTKATPAEWKQIDAVEKPWSRWWWHGSSVTKEGITAELEAFKEVGLGGLELTPIYGVLGEEDQFIDYLSREWVDLLEYTLAEAHRLGLGMDIATGTGWPFGGPWVSEGEASKYVTYKTWRLQAGEKLKEAVILKQEPILRSVLNPISQWYDQARSKGEKLTNIPLETNWEQFRVRPQITDVADPIASNENLQQLALDQLRFPKPLPLLSLMAYSEDGKVQPLTDKVANDGTLDWIAPSGNWTLYALFQGWHGKMVERAAPGGEGLVIDHFSNEAIQKYLSKFDQAFEGKDLGTLRAFFNDSYEVDDARGQANWTPNLLGEFQGRKGYDLQLHLPALLGKDSPENHARVLSDFRETVADLLLETFTAEWSKWAKGKGKIIRNQAHGSPANILDLYAASDIPETEGTDIIRSKFASSAANVTGKPLVSCEAATWLDEHFTTNLADLKENVDRYFVSGINHVFYHGTCYSPPNEAWPGRLFYAAIHANPRNTLWQHFPAINQYISRTQAILQSGKPDNDILLYFPMYDRFATHTAELLDHMDAHGPRLEASKVKANADFLVEKGYAFDFISDQQIQQLSVLEAQLIAGGNTYKTILIPETQYIPLSTMKKLISLANSGATVILHNNLPEDVPGLANLATRQQQFRERLAGLSFQASTNGVQAAKIGIGQLLLGDNLQELLTQAATYRESLVDEGLAFVRRKTNDNNYYFISNWSGKAVNQWISFQHTADEFLVLDPMTGKQGLAISRKTSNGSQEWLLHLAQGEALIFKSLSSKADTDPWPYADKTEENIPLNDNWTLTFLEGGPSLPASVKTSSLHSWTEWEGEAYQDFSGTARYSTTFAKPTPNASGWLLNLGTVHEAAQVTLNGKMLGTLIGPTFEVSIHDDLLIEQNTLEIEVSNLMANRIAQLDRTGAFWKKFYNINMSARKRENLGEAGVFDAAAWSPAPSGLLGPVSLEKMKAIE